jgi:hypothetical protein
MLNAELGKREGSDHSFGEDFGPLGDRKTQGSRETSSARDFCDTLWFAGPLAKGGSFASCQALLRFKTTAAAESKTSIAKKEK